MIYITEFKSFYNPNDIVLIEYWYNHMITPVKIIEKNGEIVVRKCRSFYDLAGTGTGQVTVEELKKEGI